MPAEQREYVQQMQAEPTAAGKLRIYAQVLPALLGRLAPLVAVTQEAGAAEPQLADLWHEIAERRAANMRRFAASLAETGELAMPVEEAADIIWATNAPEFYLLLVTQRGWSPEQYGEWLAMTWQHLLLR